MVMSFGFKNGAPSSTRVPKTFDVRDLSHDLHAPAFDDRKQEIIDYVNAHPTECVGIGCEKGQHRSRALANQVATATRTSVYHRD